MKNNKYQSNIKTYEAPETLDDHMFYGFKLDPEQRIYRDAIYDSNVKIVMCDAKAGTGKTTIAVATANLMVKYGLYDGIVYIQSPTNEQRQGYLPGDLEQKSAPYMEPLIQALYTIGEDPMKVMVSDANIEGMKNGSAYVHGMVETFLRGNNLENKVVIVDEAQNYYGINLLKTVTRVHDSCKLIIIGCTHQVDLVKHPENSGFHQYLDHFKDFDDPRMKICKLTVNHRGWISSVLDLETLRL